MAVGYKVGRASSANDSRCFTPSACALNAAKKMAVISQICSFTMLLLAIAPSRSTIVQETAPADLEAAEANGKLEIIKQIKKVNDDGSYTIGYEADDGTFKIESRDVLGNIKGTYGYVDDLGEIKRVSYSTSNTTELLAATAEPISVVQRIPAKMNRTVSSTTRRPIYVSTTSKRRLVSGTGTTTEKYGQFIKDALVASKSTPIPTTTIYETSTPARILAQAKPLVRSTETPVIPTQKSEGQLLRPDVIMKPTDMPLYRRVKTDLLDDEKPVNEEPEVRGNLLRRQLPQERGPVFDARQHAINIQQASGGDAVDVYTASHTTGTPRPLFTTSRPRIIPTTASPIIHRPTPIVRYQKIPVTTELAQESSTDTSVTPSPVPVVQIPANRNDDIQRQPFVELRHPFHRGAILVPVNPQPRHYQQEDDYPQRYPIEIQEQQQHQQPPPPEPPQLYVRRVPKFRPIPVHVDNNGYVREVPITPYPVRYVTQNDIINEVDQIRPPVSTRDFQKLLEQLILRQNSLEKISAFTREENVAKSYYNEQQVYQQPRHSNQNTGPVQFIPRAQAAQTQQYHQVVLRPQDDQQNYHPVTYSPHYQPTKRMIHSQHPHQQQLDERDEYLPAPVREMLLLRMLQLAINPALPVDDNVESPTTNQPRREAVRNVEILGEEDEQKRPSRTKRYKEIELDYFD